MPKPFHLIDVFGRDDFSGNPLAVITDADALDTEAMLCITRWLNLSETTFLLPPTDPAADYRVRIFSLSGELPFAGHPTLGTCHAWLEAGGVPKDPAKIVQQCAAGLIPIQRGAERLAFAAPPMIRTGAVDEKDLSEIAGILRIGRERIVEARWIDNGPGWVGILLASAEEVLALEPLRDHPHHVDIGVVGPHPAGGEAAYEVRAFFSNQHGGIVEDPVTGSLNASVAQWLFASGRVSAPYIAAQGTRLGRTGRVHIAADTTGQIWVGGATRTLFAGTTRD